MKLAVSPGLTVHVHMCILGWWSGVWWRLVFVGGLQRLMNPHISQSKLASLAGHSGWGHGGWGAGWPSITEYMLVEWSSQCCGCSKRLKYENYICWVGFLTCQGCFLTRTEFRLTHSINVCLCTLLLYGEWHVCCYDTGVYVAIWRLTCKWDWSYNWCWGLCIRDKFVVGGTIA